MVGSLSNDALLRAISEDRALGCELLFERQHTQKSPKFHVHMMDLWRSRDQLVVIVAFRSAAKTTKAIEFLCLEGCYANSPYTLLVAETFTKGCERLESIKYEIMTNRKLGHLFGRMKGGTWREDFIELSNGAVLQAAGWDQELTGFLHHEHRPWRAYLDDIENRENVKDVDANWHRLWRELWPALDKVNRKLRMTGTPLAADCMITRAANSPDFTAGLFPICVGDIDDPKAESIWPERYPMEWIRSERDMFARNGELPTFIQEFLLISKQTQAKPFHDESIRYMDVAPHAARFLPRKTIIDPARTVDVRKSAHTGHVTVARMGTTILVFESGGDFWQPSEVVKYAFEAHEKFDAQVCIEKNGLDEWLMQPIRAEALRCGKALPLKAITAPRESDKEQFITSLQPWFQAKEIVLIGDRAKHAQLVAQIGNFPAGRKDILNALAYATLVFGGEPVYSEVGDAHVIADLDPALDAVLYLCVAGDATLVCAALVAVEGSTLSVLADWASNLPAADVITDVSTVVNAMYPRHRLNVSVPREIYDQADRSTIVKAVRNARLNLYPGQYSQVSRAALLSHIRTEMRGRRLLRIDERARLTIAALMGGYQYPIGKGAKQGGEPEYGPYRFIVEAIETNLTIFGVRDQNVALPEGAPTALNPQGVAYMTSMPNRSRRK